MDQVFRRMIRLQFVVTLLVAALASGLTGIRGGFSAVVGGGAAIVGCLAAAWVVARNKRDQDAGVVLVGLLKAEAIKILVIVLLLWLVFKLYSGLVPLALIGGLGAAALLSGAAIFSINEKNN